MRWTEIILGVLTLLGGCAWFVNFRKDKQEAKGIRADNRQKEMDLSKMYVDEFNLNIVVPLQREVGELRQEVAALRNAIQKIDACPHRDNCPVIGELQRKSAGK